MVTAMNTATVAQYNVYILALFPLPYEMEAIIKNFIIINVMMKPLQSHILPYSFLLAPSRIISSPGTQTLTEGSNLDLYCNTTGKPPPNITWTRVLEDGTNSKVLFVGSPWHIVNIRRNFTGQYRCTADNGIGSPVNHTFLAIVLCEYTLHFLLSLILLFGPINVSQLYLELNFSWHILIFFVQ